MMVDRVVRARLAGLVAVDLAQRADRRVVRVRRHEQAAHVLLDDGVHPRVGVIPARVLQKIRVDGQRDGVL